MKHAVFVLYCDKSKRFSQSDCAQNPNYNIKRFMSFYTIITK